MTQNLVYMVRTCRCFVIAALLLLVVRPVVAAEFKMKDGGSISGELVEELILFQRGSTKIEISSVNIAHFAVQESSDIDPHAKLVVDEGGGAIRAGSMYLGIQAPPFLFKEVKLKDGGSLGGATMVGSTLKLKTTSGFLTVSLKQVDSYIPEKQRVIIRLSPLLPFTFQRAIIRKSLDLTWMRFESLDTPWGRLDPPNSRDLLLLGGQRELREALAKERPPDPGVVILKRD